MTKLKVHILTPEWSRDVEADAVFLPGSVCPFEVLPEHAPMISLLDAGCVRWRESGAAEESLDVKGGVVKIDRNEMKICVEV